MKNLNFLAIGLMLFAAFSCKDADKSVYADCCGNPPTEDSFDIPFKDYDAQGNLVDTILKAGVYISNIIATDYSGDNNFFLVSGSAAVIKVRSFKCTDEKGTLLFEQTNFLPNDSGKAWNGVKADGTIYQGSFNYEAVIEYVDGQLKTFIGKACAYTCNSEGFPTQNIPNCFFPSQYDGNGGIDENLPKYESCF